MRCGGIAAVAVVLFALAAAAHAGNQLSGTVTRVSDGDTLWVRPDGVPRAHAKPRAVRLRGIDAPEKCQAWGPQAKAALESRVLHRRVHLRSHASDDYRRSVVTLDVMGEDIGAWMVAQGHAWNTRFRHGVGVYAAQEQAARRAGRGLFADARAVEPRQFRKLHGRCR
jgi:micrococcal nuclease